MVPSKSLKQLLNPLGMGWKERSLDECVERTRQWVLEEVKKWKDKEPREEKLLLLTAGAGFGKSVVAQLLIKQDWCAAGYVFDWRDQETYADPVNFVKTIAFALAEKLDGYRRVLERDAEELKQVLYQKGLSGRRLFSEMLVEKLEQVEYDGKQMVMVIDGLDEAVPYEGGEEILAILKELVSQLPDWLRVVAMSRPESSVLEALNAEEVLVLGLDDDGRKKSNQNDAAVYVKSKLPGMTLEEGLDESAVVLALVERSEQGNMVFLSFLTDDMKRNAVTEESLRGLPRGLKEWYGAFFTKRLPDLLRDTDSFGEVMGENNIVPVEQGTPIHNLLLVAVAALGQLPVDEEGIAMGLLLGCDGQTALDLQAAFSVILLVHRGCLQLPHKSMADWLIHDSKKNRHTLKFSVTLEEAHAFMTTRARAWLIERTGERSDPMKRYWQQHLNSHIIYEPIQEKGSISMVMHFLEKLREEMTEREAKAVTWPQMQLGYLRITLMDDLSPRGLLLHFGAGDFCNASGQLLKDLNVSGARLYYFQGISLECVMTKVAEAGLQWLIATGDRVPFKQGETLAAVKWSELTSLRVLALPGCGLSGAIPVELGQLSSLQVLDLSDNHLSGAIPVELGQLSSLQVLHLSGNDLSGAIPVELGQLTSLGELHLERNQLSHGPPNRLESSIPFCNHFPQLDDFHSSAACMRWISVIIIFLVPYHLGWRGLPYRLPTYLIVICAFICLPFIFGQVIVTCVDP
ncbi:unnamed protein product [Chrysoparadoxa australica]